MINPKVFYRKLDTLLTDIYNIKGIDILPTVLKELVHFLGEDLHIIDGHLYEEDDGKFELIFSTSNKEYTPHLFAYEDVVQLTLEHTCYIFNEPQDLQQSSIMQKENTIPASFVVNNEEKHWIFIFELGSGWEREEIELSLNTVRKVLNSRISSEQFQNYLHQAELIQKSLLPVKIPEIPAYDIAAQSIPTEFVGGDLYDIIVFDEEHFGVSVGDASGHGLPAALLVRDVVTGLRMGLEKHMKMTYALEKLNRVIHRSRLSTSFISLFYAELEANGNIIYVNAGHPTPLLIKKDRIEKFTIGGLVLGPLPEVNLKRGFKFMEKDDILIMYSDGVIERKNKFGEPFELERLKNICIANRNLSAAEILDNIIEKAYHFGNNAKWADDITAVVIKKVN